MKIAVLWSQTSGYLSASLQALEQRGHEIFVNSFPGSNDAPFSDETLRWLAPERRGQYFHRADLRNLLSELEAFGPHVLLISGWNHPAYLAAARAFRRRAVRVLCMDNPWKETPKQWLGRTAARWRVRPYFDLATVPGERQYQFARRLGFHHAAIVSGLLSCDYKQFDHARQASSERANKFIYVGRLSPEKGVDLLASAYRRYRQQVQDPWPLTVVGAGPLAPILAELPGVDLRGFVQPGAIAPILASHRILLVPSHRESWGVQIHEGAAAGLAIICTSVCGACAHLVRDGFNGYVVEPGDPIAFSKAMSDAANADAGLMGEASASLARQITPDLWASNLLRGVAAHPPIGGAS